MSARPEFRGSVALLPAAPGVYRFRDARGRTLYIGRAVDLRRRVGSYWGDLKDRRHLARMVPRIARVEAAVCDSEHEAAWLERNLLERSLPPWNRTPGGAEVPLCLELGERLAVARLDEPPTGARRFGPYLGGLRVRLALSALERVLPLAYAAERLTGSERDLARVLGVAAVDRARLLSSIAAVLDRDPVALAALRQALVARRDAATERLAFELAGRLQAELAAIAWVAAEQKVTRLEPASFDVTGWAHGVQVRFEMRDGRLSAWQTRSCAEAAARGPVSATPPEWTAFAQRNAELAARLAG